MSITNFSPAVEKARHQELSLSQRIGKNSVQVAFYDDGIADPVLTGIGLMAPGEMMAEAGEVLPDIYSGTFSYQGNDFSTRGVRLVLQRKLFSDLTATLDYPTAASSTCPAPTSSCRTRGIGFAPNSVRPWPQSSAEPYPGPRPAGSPPIATWAVAP